MRALIALALLALAGPSFAQTCAAPATTVARDGANLAWNATTQNTDGTPVKTPVTYTVYEGTTARCTTTAVVAGLTALSVGAHTWTVTAKTSDGESAKSNAATKTILPAPPNAPTNLQVTDPTAYEIRTSSGQLVASRLGLVQLGTLCNSGESQTVAGVTYYRVDLRSVDLVNWPSASPLTAKAWARCG
jgi:hypothetical protein